jgi:hypothetical protein
MSLLSRADVVRQVLVDRTHAIPLLVGDDDAPAGSRIGGAVPAVLAGEPPRCPACGRQLLYHLTLEADVLGPLLPSDRALSVLVCPDIVCRLRSGRPQDVPSLVILAHDASPRAPNPGPNDSDLPGRRIASGPVALDEQRFGRRIRPLELSKIGGTPHYIQEEPSKGEALEEEGLRFLFQWNEGSYPPSFFSRDLPLRAGGLWAFAELDPVSHGIGGTIRAFWERT